MSILWLVSLLCFMATDHLLNAEEKGVSGALFPSCLLSQDVNTREQALASPHHF